MTKNCFVGDDVFEKINAELAQMGAQNVFFLVDENTHEHCLPRLLAELPNLSGYEVLEIEPGEASKDAEIALNLWGTLAELGADRQSLIINLGGGVVTDLGGFVAATYKRGIRFWNIPTSLLGMVDAAIGGKTGVDVEGIKNLAGTFSQAEAIFVNPDFLETLPIKHLKSGFAEVFKHGLIADANYFKFACAAWNNNEYSSVVADSIRIKNSIVFKDEKENGLRKVLNFGHTLGHAVESFFIEKGEAILHGEAVAAGMMMACNLSVSHAGLAQNTANEIVQTLAQIYPKLGWNGADETQIMGWLMHDKKNINGALRFVLLRELGDAIFDVSVSMEEAASALKWYRETIA